MKRVLVFALVLAGTPSGFSQDPNGEKLLLSFEQDEIKTIVDEFKLERKEGKDSDGGPTVSVGKPFFLYPHWTLGKAKASHGEYSIGLGVARWSDAGDTRSPLLKPPADAQRLYGVFRDNYASILNTCGVFRKLMPMDWSESEVLRLDVYAVEGQATIRVQLEDEEIAPPVARNFVVKPEQWTTLELDLRAAAKVRSLDLKRMATLSAALVKTEKKSKGMSGWLDNIRLAPAKAPARFPVVRDDSPLELPEYYRNAGKPAPRPPPLAPDRAPLTGEKPILIPLDRPGVTYQGGLTDVSHVGWAAAYDNKHLLVGFRDASDAWTLQSLDGGQTWKGLDGGEKPTNVPLDVASDHGAGRGDVIGGTADVVVLSNNGCNGASRATVRFYAHKLSFTATGWKLQAPMLVACDPRHCVSNQSIVRTSDGRWWCGFGEVGRLGTLQSNVQYSDDEGETWKSSREGTSGVIPGTIWPEKFGVGFPYTYEEPCLVPFGPGVACLWEEGRKGNAPTTVKWARFDGVKWSAVEEVPAGPIVNSYLWFRPRMHAVSVGGKEVYLASGLRAGIFRYRDGTWSKEPVDVPPGARLSVAGDKTVMAFAVPAKDKNVVLCWQRRPDGTWTGPRELMRETEPITGMKGPNMLFPGLVVMAYAPSNFVPVAWTCQGQKWIKFLRVPVDAGQ